jgi:hypothetical protein
VFETRRVGGQAWLEQGVTLMGDPDLVVKVGGNLYSWQVRGGRGVCRVQVMQCLGRLQLELLVHVACCVALCVSQLVGRS